jgi:type III restriction enzyme
LQGIVISKNEIQTSLHHVSNINTENIDSTLVGSTTTKARSYDSNLDLIHELARSTALARTTVFKIWEQLPIEQIFSACQNPMQFLAEATKKLRKVVADEMVRLVVYKKTDKQLSADELFQQVEETKSDTTATPDKGLYDYIKHDSDIEQDMAIEFDNNASVKLFFKLPDNYKIPTPIGNYTPDFALVMEKKNLDNNTDAPTNYYFVIETKGTDDIDKLKPDEKLKIQCAIKHFEAIGLRSYLAPVHNTTSFDKKSYEQTQQTFFNL